jgi:uncharacterized Zn-binding protein involved in type VI secretion
MRRFLILTTALVLGGLLAACNGDSTGPGSIFGTYTLVTVNGENVPVTLVMPPDTPIVFNAGWIRLDSDSTYTISMTVDGVTPDPGDGAFTVNGSSIAFSGDFSGTGTISGNTLTIVEDGGTFVFLK